MENNKDIAMFCEQKLCIVIVYLLVATSTSMALIGIYINELLLVESGFKVFTTLLILRLVFSGFRGVFSTAISLLLLLLLFYLSIVYKGIMVFTYIFSCVMVATIFVSTIRGVSRVFLIINWYVIATISLHLFTNEAYARYLSMLVPMILIMAFFISRALSIPNRLITCDKLRTKSTFGSTVEKLYGIRAIPSNIYGKVLHTALTVKSKLHAFETRILNIQKKTLKTINTVLQEMANLELSTINLPNTLLVVLKTSMMLEKYINSFTSNIVSSLIRGTAGVSKVERLVANRFQMISIRVEGLQHEVEHALLYVLFLMSILLLAALVFYIILYT